MAPEPEYLLVTEYFHPDTASTGQLMTDLAVGLDDGGLDVTGDTGPLIYHGEPGVSSSEQRMAHESVSTSAVVSSVRSGVRAISLVSRYRFSIEGLAPTDPCESGELGDVWTETLNETDPWPGANGNLGPES